MFSKLFLVSCRFNVLLCVVLRLVVVVRCVCLFVVVYFVSGSVSLLGSMEFSRLTRKHGLKICPGFRCSVEECALAVAEVVGAGSVRSAARMNGAVVIFVDEVKKS